METTQNQNTTPPAALRAKANSPWHVLGTKEPVGYRLQHYLWSCYEKTTNPNLTFQEWYESLNRN